MFILFIRLFLENISDLFILIFHFLDVWKLIKIVKILFQIINYIICFIIFIVMSAAFENFDLYEELEIKKTATPEEIKKAYRKLAMVKLNLKSRNGIRIRISKIQNAMRNSKESLMLIQVKFFYN